MSRPRASGRNAGCSILVDARGLYASGIGRYLREVLAALLSDSRFQRITLLGDPVLLEQFVGERNVTGEIRIFSYPNAFYSPRVQLAWAALQMRRVTTADVSFFPHYDAPLRLPARSVVTVHDLTHFKVPEAFPAWRRAVAGMLLQRVVAGAARVLTVSAATSRDLAERIPCATQKVEVVPNGVSEIFRPLSRDEEANCGPIAALRPFVLCVGNRKPHKNLRVAIEAVALLRQSSPQIRLVFTGPVYPEWEAIMHHAEVLGVADAILDLGRVNDSELRCLYAHCDAFLFPSLYEGFGLPVLEAMACGAPVVASDRGALPEVVGDAGILVNATDVAAIVEAVGCVTQPAIREQLSKRGRARARCFPWRRTTDRTLDVLYETALGKPATISGVPQQDTLNKVWGHD